MSPDRTRLPNEDSQKHTIESISNVFTCFICLGRVKNARLCPHCSKLCCYECISKWIMQSRAQCPHCLNTLHLMDLVHCRWAEEITQRLSHLQTLKSNEKALTDLDKCKSHNEPLSVYCSTCSRIVCHQCALFDSKHNKHQFKPLDDVVKQKIKDLTSDIHCLEERRSGLNAIVEQVNDQITGLMQAKDERMNEIRSNMDLVISRLESECKLRLAKLLSHKHRVLQEGRVLDTLQQELLTALDKLSKSQMILFCEDFKTVFSRVHSQPISVYACPTISKEFPNPVLPSFDQATIVLNNFTECQQKGEPVYSEPLHMSGLCWRLKIYPTGNGNVKGSYLSIFLELSDGLNKSSNYEYRIEMINQRDASSDGSNNVSREFASDFEVGECWGYNRFFQLNRLRTEGFVTTQNDSLLIKFQIRTPTYQLKCRDQQWYIEQLETRQGQLLKEIEDLKQQLNSSNKPENELMPAELPENVPFMAKIIDQSVVPSIPLADSPRHPVMLEQACDDDRDESIGSALEQLRESNRSNGHEDASWLEPDSETGLSSNADTSSDEDDDDLACGAQNGLSETPDMRFSIENDESHHSSGQTMAECGDALLEGVERILQRRSRQISGHTEAEAQLVNYDSLRDYVESILARGPSEMNAAEIDEGIALATPWFNQQSYQTPSFSSQNVPSSTSVLQNPVSDRHSDVALEIPQNEDDMMEELSNQGSAVPSARISDLNSPLSILDRLSNAATSNTYSRVERGPFSTFYHLE